MRFVIPAATGATMPVIAGVLLGMADMMLPCDNQIILRLLAGVLCVVGATNVIAAVAEGCKS